MVRFGGISTNIKLFVCCHRESHVPDHELLIPIQVGTALVRERYDGFCYDDEGIHISNKNRSYCELTAQYWAWKNVDADYYGFFHYRRYIYPNQAKKRPYRIMAEPNKSALYKLGYDHFSDIIKQYDLIAPIGENMYVSVRKHYRTAAYHHGKDLDLVETIIRERHPEMVPAMEGYLSGTVCYFGNIYIMCRQVFRDYCSWLFPILEEFDQRTDKTGYSAQELRVNGYLAERLFGIWMTYVRSDLRVCELPRVHFMGKKAMKGCLLNRFLPAGSRRRSMVKRVKKLVTECRARKV